MIKSYGICQVAIAPVRASASDEAEIVTQLLFGDYVKVLEQEKPWIKIYFPADDYEGWMDFKQLKYVSEDIYQEGIDTEHEVVKTGLLAVEGPIGKQHIIFGSNLPFLNGSEFEIGTLKCKVLDEIPEFDEDFCETALRYLNTPYLWGGKGILGIDCSGFVQIAAKVHGINIPRDASEQAEVGAKVRFDNRQEGDLMFFVNKNGHVHHVGIILNEKEIIHAAGHVRIDTYDEKGIFRLDFDKHTHKFHSIKRIWNK
ncbi:MAG: C40 family peptidase [Crocinitomicaceae bacterium]|nr:C40 family peptidase [Crocinitomicaceae bacterium]